MGVAGMAVTAVQIGPEPDVIDGSSTDFAQFPDRNHQVLDSETMDQEEIAAILAQAMGSSLGLREGGGSPDSIAMNDKSRKTGAKDIRIRPDISGNTPA
jgi:hypothetical protein